MKPVRNIDTGEIYHSLKEAKEETGIIGIGDCCLGRQKTAGNYHWEYIEDNK
jgi:hypothetical protein